MSRRKGFSPEDTEWFSEMGMITVTLMVIAIASIAVLSSCPPLS